MQSSMKIAALVGSIAVAASACGTPTSGGDGGPSNGLNSLPAQNSVSVPSNAVKPPGNGKAECSDVTIAYIGAQTGPNAQLGINTYTGAQLAINQHNEANPRCQVGFKKFDTEGDPSKATGPVTQATNDQNVIGVLGLPFSGESAATGNIFEQAGLVHITASATDPTLTTKGWTTFFRGLGNNDAQGAAAAKLAEKLGAKKVYVVGDDTEAGGGLAKLTASALGDRLAGTDNVTTGQKDFSAVVSKIMNAKPDAVYYGGYYPEAAPLDQQLVLKGFKGNFISDDSVKDPQFVKLAGSASSNAYFTCPCLPGDLVPSFADAYKSLSKGSQPGTYSLEGYDAMTVLLTGIDKGKTTRASLLEFVKTYDGQGLSKRFKWDSTGELSDSVVYGYKVDKDAIVSIGLIK